MAPETKPAVHIRDLRESDLDEVVRIDALHTGEAKPSYWRRIFDAFLSEEGADGAMGLGVDGEGGLAGYLFGEVRAVEFGSEPCGWIFAVGVEPQELRTGIAKALLERAVERFREFGVTVLRTMVRRNDVPVLSFFRSGGFVGGLFAQLELDLEAGLGAGGES